MALVQMKDTVLHPVELNDNPSDTASHGFRFEAGEVYEVDDATAMWFTTHGWALKVAGAAAAAADVAEPWNTQDATDADAEEWDAKAADRLSRARGGDPRSDDLDVQDSESGASAQV